MAPLRLLKAFQSIGLVRALLGIAAVLLFAQPALAAPPAAGAVPPVITVSGRASIPSRATR